MRKLREIARLKCAAGRTFEEIAAAVGIARSTVPTALGRLSAAGLSWPWPAALDEAAVEARLIRVSRGRRAWPARYRTLPRSQRVIPQRGDAARLWVEYREREAAGLEYSQFCTLYRQWRKTQDVVLRLEHVPGDKLFVDYAGLTMPVIDPRTRRFLSRR